MVGNLLAASRPEALGRSRHVRSDTVAAAGGQQQRKQQAAAAASDNVLHSVQLRSKKLRWSKVCHVGSGDSAVDDRP